MNKQHLLFHIPTKKMKIKVMKKRRILESYFKQFLSGFNSAYLTQVANKQFRNKI